MTSSLDKTIDIKHYIRMFWRHKGLILLCTVTALCACFIALAFMPNVYESDVVLTIRDTQLLARDVERLTGGILPSPTGRDIDEQRMAALAGRIRSRPFLERVVRMLKMNEDPVIREMAERRRHAHPDVSVDEMAIRILVQNLQGRIRFGILGPGVYKVTVGDYSARNAQLVAWWISELFVEVSDQETLADIRNARQLGQDLVRTYTDQLRQSEEALERYRQGAIDRDLGYSLIQSQNVIFAETLRQHIQEAASDARVLASSSQKLLSDQGISADVDRLLRDPEISDLGRALAASLWNEVVARLSTTGTGATDDWPPQGAYSSHRRALLQRAESVAAREYAEATQEVMGVLARTVFSRVDAQGQESAAAALGAEIAKFRRQLELGPRGEMELASLQADVDQNRRLVQTAEEQVVGTDVRGAIEGAKLGVKINILDPARVPLAPSHPNRKKLILASILMGGLLGAGMAFIMETMDPVLRTVEDFGRIVPEPVLGTTPLLSRRLIVKRGWLRRYWVPATLVTVMLLTGGFFLMRGQVLYKLAATQVPIQMVSPEMVPDANR